MLQSDDVRSLERYRRVRNEDQETRREYYCVEREVEVFKEKLKEPEEENSKLQKKFNWLM